MIKKLIFSLIFLLAFILRFWQLGNNPPSLDWDEASLGYNAYSILKTAKDEYGTFLPLSIRSFNDYKPPLYTYLTVIPVALFGLNEFSTRFMSAFLGSISILIGFYLVKELFPSKGKLFYLFFMFLFAISPWHIQFSRVAFEANTALFFFLTGFWLFLKGRASGKLLILSAISFALSMYAYHSPRLVIPVVLLALVFVYRKEMKRRIIWGIVSFILLCILVTPIISQLRSSTGARFGSVTLLNPAERLGPSIDKIEFDQKNNNTIGKLMHNRRLVFGREILAGYLDHFNFDFLFLTGDAPGRHHAVGMGMLYLWELPFILLGLYTLLSNREKGSCVLILWFLTAPIASSLTTGTPHAVRALLYVPTYQIFAAFGITEFISYVTRTIPKRLAIPSPSEEFRSLRRFSHSFTQDHLGGVPLVRLGIYFFAFLLLILNFFYYMDSYWIHTPREDSESWQYGYKEAVGEVVKLENHFDKIVVTYRYDQPYIFFLFYNKIDPSWYQSNWGAGEIKRSERNFGKYEFRNIDWSKDFSSPKTLFVGTAGEIPESANGIIREIKFRDGSAAFRIAASL